jgi:hypothetical protein
MQNKIKIWSAIFAVFCLLATILTACGSPATKIAPAAERPAGPADKVELVLFHFTQR